MGGEVAVTTHGWNRDGKCALCGAVEADAPKFEDCPKAA